MQTHQEIDLRSLAMARAIAARIDADPTHGGLDKARDICRRWNKRRSTPAVREWLDILTQPWERVRNVLLDESEEGKRLRQSNPFGGVLTPQERWQIYREFQKDETKRA